MTEQSKLTDAEKNALLDRLDEEVRLIRTREDLGAFAEALGRAHAMGAFEEGTTNAYLHGVSGALRNLHGYCRNQGLPDPKQPDWHWMGEILYLAFYNM